MAHARLVGKYESDIDISMREFFITLAEKVGMDLSKFSQSCRMPNRARSTVEITYDSGVYTIESIIRSKVLKATFSVNEEFDEIHNGKMIKSKATVDGNKIIIKSGSAEQSGSRTYEVNGNQLLITIVSSEIDIVGRAIFKRI